ncbi:hypothetical protein LTR62_008840 [Meristemomyces frigidus]|uniref:Uncharacterized protein n=1 Tax=Meristemomyces frigidus TaxID=1508187 RepID=A0AAN7TAA4_9PEZI|nr:hypothetical protein LTR62_008840 [Meristemomyces frigidus]
MVDPEERRRVRIHGKKQNQQHLKQGAKPVRCQRFFVGATHSQYFGVRQVEAASRQQARPHTKFAAMGRLWERATDHAEASEKQEQDQSPAGQVAETTPWVRRTGRDWYLQGCSRSDLLECIAEPNEPETPRSAENDGDESEVEWAGREDYVLWQTRHPQEF